MAEPDLLAYVGAIGGVVGAITGIAGAIIAYVSYKKTEQLKVLDLRIELGRLVVGLLEDVHGLAGLMERAKKSRSAVSAATGMRNSGAMERWSRQWDADQNSVATLQQGVDDLNQNHGIATPKELEGALIDAHALQKSVERIRQTYEESLAADEKKRDELREVARDRVASSQRSKE